VEGASEAVVAEESGLLRPEAKVLGDAAGGPLGKPVEGAACQQEVGDEGAESDGGGDVFGAPAGGRQGSGQEGPEVQAVRGRAGGGGGANFEGFEGGGGGRG